MERARCKDSPIYFLKKYGKVKDAEKGIIPYEDWPHLTETLRALREHRLVIILKARQIGMTWLTAGYALWMALFHEGSNVVLLSKGEPQAAETLDYIRFMHNQLPSFLQVTLQPDQSSLIGFPKMHSKIRALAAVASAGIGFGGASLIVNDEWDLWDEQDKVRRNYAEIKPMIDKSGQMLILSAINKYDQDTKFKELFLQARAGENNFYPLFFSYDVLAYRDKGWYEQQKREYDQWELEGRYPKTWQEALSAPELVCRFDVQKLKEMETDTRFGPLSEEQNGLIKIYKEGVAGRRYCLIADPSEGYENSDPCAGQVIDWATCEKVAEFHGRVPIDEQAVILKGFYDNYYQPFTAIERNAPGLNLITKLQELGLKTWYYCDKAREKAGWYTSGGSGQGGNRPVMITDLADAIFKRQLREPNPEALDEFHTFIRTKKKREGEARSGAHDEYVIMWAIFLQIRNAMPTGGQSVYVSKYTM